MYAEWVAVTTSVSDDTIYIDPEIRRKGELVEMWALIDSKLAKHLPPASYFLSMRLLQLSGGTGRHSLSLFTSSQRPFPCCNTITRKSVCGCLP